MKCLTNSRISLAVMVFLAIGSTAAGDTIFIGNDLGEIVPRDEFDLATPLTVPGFAPGQVVLSFGGPFPTSAEFGITALAIGKDGGGFPALLIGTGDGRPHVRTLSDMSFDAGPTTKFTNSNVGSFEPITNIADRGDGDVIITTAFTCCPAPAPQAGAVFMRDPANLTLVAPGHTGGDGAQLGSTGTAISALGVLSTGDFVVGNVGGEVLERNGTNVFAPAFVAQPEVSFGVPVNALAVLSDDRIVIGLDDGTIDVRPFTDLQDNSAGNTVNFGVVSVTALAVLPGDLIAIGLSNGEVHVRDPNAVGGVTTILGNSAALTLDPLGLNNPDITALSVTSNGNLVVGTEDNLVFVQDPADVSLSVGLGSGTVFNGAISALATANIVLQVNLPGDFDSNGFIDLLDFNILALNFGTLAGATNSTGDADGDGDVDNDDFIILQQGFGTTPTPPLVVPEPATLGLLLGGVTLVAGRRKGRQRH
jgi:PEP-CTERM motif